MTAEIKFEGRRRKKQKTNRKMITKERNWEREREKKCNIGNEKEDGRTERRGI